MSIAEKSEALLVVFFDESSGLFSTERILLRSGPVLFSSNLDKSIVLLFVLILDGENAFW